MCYPKRLLCLRFGNLKFHHCFLFWIVEMILWHLFSIRYILVLHLPHRVCFVCSYVILLKMCMLWLTCYELVFMLYDVRQLIMYSVTCSCYKIIGFSPFQYRDCIYSQKKVTVSVFIGYIVITLNHITFTLQEAIDLQFQFCISMNENLTVIVLCLYSGRTRPWFMNSSPSPIIVLIFLKYQAFQKIWRRLFYLLNKMNFMQM